ncbi:hypothetical protein CHUAL_009165, partial [Chamberlinius hualienensis]
MKIEEINKIIRILLKYSERSGLFLLSKNMDLVVSLESLQCFGENLNSRLILDN